MLWFWSTDWEEEKECIPCYFSDDNSETNIVVRTEGEDVQLGNGDEGVWIDIDIHLQSEGDEQSHGPHWCKKPGGGGL